MFLKLPLSFFLRNMHNGMLMYGCISVLAYKGGVDMFPRLLLYPPYPNWAKQAGGEKRGVLGEELEAAYSLASL